MKQSDLTQRLRDQASRYEQDPGYMDDAALNRAAADEIERLRDELSQLRSPVADERISLRGAANLAFNALHECKPVKGAEKQYSDAVQALQSALHDIAYTVNRTTAPQQFADHPQREAHTAHSATEAAQGEHQ
ncbi:hypothetical protein ACOTH5_31765 [Achromobacter xylosoxidans]|uniref:hypothetical protein n=1 Tax=Alcaligenes xylosoxydans xylosoxydans TaxID=85698 RepID=UPI00047D6F4C|nr:hypothetical protein [Achromobacter xylosoxidans]QQE59200.1 hypothetical protein I6H41_09445 [Achromobacter xylosoxidans]QQV12944.1 hypothetical protein I6I48_24565 [Achromobacter xylosoxidans]